MTEIKPCPQVVPRAIISKVYAVRTGYGGGGGGRWSESPDNEGLFLIKNLPTRFYYTLYIPSPNES